MSPLHLRRRVATARRLAAEEGRRRLSARARGGIVLLYHRVADLEADPQLLSVAPANFDAHMELLASACTPLPLAELAERVRNGKVPPGAVAVTFDDGYRDNLEAALPRLTRHSVPATVFVATGYVGTAREFWWDEFERLLLLPEGGTGAVRAGGDGFRFDLATAAGREDAYARAHRLLRQRTPETIDAALGHLREQLGEPPEGAGRDSYRAMNPDELRRLVESGLVVAGAHTRRHPSLAAQPLERQREEIEGSRDDLADWLGAPPATFSYPFGTPGVDFRRDTARLVEDAGFATATANFPGRVTRWSDRFRLERLLVRDWTVDELERQLAGFARAG